MQTNPLARLTAALLATLAGLALCLACLRTAAAAAPGADQHEPSFSPVWFVSLFPGEGLVAYWKFDQVFDHKTFNATPITVHSILTGTSDIITTTVPPTVTVPDFGALELDGLTGAVVVTSSPGLDVAPSSFSLAAWVRRGALGATQAIYDSGTESHKWWVFIGSNNRLSFENRGLVVPGVLSSTKTIDTNWHHVAVVKNGNGTKNLTFYIDGAASGVFTATGVLTPSGDQNIGVLSDSGLLFHFKGQLDELRLYRRALSAAEVGRLAAGRGCVATGTSWGTAFDDPQCALDVAGNGDQVWLAQGTYVPGTAREASFHLLKNLSLLGGFLGSESSPAQRPAFDPFAPLTALSGDVAGDDQPAIFGNYADNACNVVSTGNKILPLLAPISATFDGLAIQDGNARCDPLASPQTNSGGGLVNFSAVHLALNNLVFQANEAQAAGGGLQGGGAMILNAVRFAGNQAAGGGGLAMSSGSLTLTAASFADNSAEEGGAIEIADPLVAHTGVFINGSDFSGNQASDSGGALYAQIPNGAVDLIISQSTFTGNGNSGGDGGALDNICLGSGGVRALVSHSTFTGNVAEEDGGAISDFACQTTLAGNTFSNNRSPNGQGGALVARSLITVTGGTFQNNSALDSGGAVTVFGTLVMSGSTVTQNHANNPSPPSDFTPMGGGVLVSGTALITNSQFISNSAVITGVENSNLAEGGGLAVTGNLALSAGRFQGNTAEHGGGLYALGSADIRGALFLENTAGSGGGAFADGALVFVANRLIGNQALEELTNGSSQGGGLLLQNGNSGVVSTNLFVDNHAATLDAGGTARGAALSLDGSVNFVTNNTIVSHNPVTVSAAVITGSNGLFNNIITSHAVGLQVLGGLTIEDYNLFSGDAVTVIGAINSVGHSRVADPRFIDAAHSDFSLRLDSPAIDAGDNNRVPGLVTTDLNGGPRFVDVRAVADTGAGSPPIVDLGAFEFVGDRLFLPLLRR